MVLGFLWGWQSCNSYTTRTCVGERHVWEYAILTNPMLYLRLHVGNPAADAPWYMFQTYTFLLLVIQVHAINHIWIRRTYELTTAVCIYLQRNLCPLFRKLIVRIGVHKCIITVYQFLIYSIFKNLEYSPLLFFIFWWKYPIWALLNPFHQS